MLDSQESFISMVLSGVPQDPVLTSLLILCYINDLPAQITSNVRLYSHNVLVCILTRNSDYDCKNAQNDINKLLIWTQDWQMEFNFSELQKETNYSIHIHII